jgi:hypothetical protein
LLGALDELNGHSICAPHTCISLASVLKWDSENSFDRKIPAGRYQSLIATLASNASDTAVAAFCIDGLPQFEMVSEGLRPVSTSKYIYSNMLVIDQRKLIFLQSLQVRKLATVQDYFPWHNLQCI